MTCKRGSSSLFIDGMYSMVASTDKGIDVVKKGWISE